MDCLMLPLGLCDSPAGLSAFTREVKTAASPPALIAFRAVRRLRSLLRCMIVSFGECLDRNTVLEARSTDGASAEASTGGGLSSSGLGSLPNDGDQQAHRRV